MRLGICDSFFLVNERGNFRKANEATYGLEYRSMYASVTRFRNISLGLAMEMKNVEKHARSDRAPIVNTDSSCYFTFQFFVSVRLIVIKVESQVKSVPADIWRGSGRRDPDATVRDMASAYKYRGPVACIAHELADKVLQFLGGAIKSQFYLEPVQIRWGRSRQRCMQRMHCDAYRSHQGVDLSRGRTYMWSHVSIISLQLE